MEINVLRATELWQRAGAYSVRIQGMARQHHIPLQQEFDEHDGPDTKYIVLLDDIYPVATCRFYEVGEETVMIGRVVVLPEYRGAGLGRRVMEEAQQWIKELGYARIRIESRVEAVRFYEKLGFTADSSEDIFGGTFHCIAMEKAVDL